MLGDIEAGTDMELYTTAHHQNCKCNMLSVENQCIGDTYLHFEPVQQIGPKVLSHNHLLPQAKWAYMVIRL
jgi:hypothetical protein